MTIMVSQKVVSNCVFRKVRPNSSSCILSGLDGDLLHKITGHGSINHVLATSSSTNNTSVSCINWTERVDEKSYNKWQLWHCHSYWYVTVTSTPGVGLTKQLIPQPIVDCHRSPAQSGQGSIFQSQILFSKLTMFSAYMELSLRGLIKI